MKGLIAVSDRPHVGLGAGPGEERLIDLLPKLEFLAVFLLEWGVSLPDTAAILPATTFSEKDGTMINDRGRVQRLRPATELPRAIRPENDVLQEVLLGLKVRDRQAPPSTVFRELAPELGLEGITYKEIGGQGLLLK